MAMRKKLRKTATELPGRVRIQIKNYEGYMEVVMIVPSNVYTSCKEYKEKNARAKVYFKTGKKVKGDKAVKFVYPVTDEMREGIFEDIEYSFDEIYLSGKIILHPEFYWGDID